MVYAAIRLRGKINVKPKIKETLKLLNLTRTNHCVLIKEKKENKGMLQKTKDFITWGEIDQEHAADLIKKRGRLKGGKNITDKYIKSSTSYENIDDISKDIVKDKIKYRNIPDVKPIFRLNPPEKGLKSIKGSFKNKGSLGYRGKEINALLDRMI